ncbi:MAG: F0F1 ATP synthase subunit delta [Gammaproteobacteria bacterium]|nr:F0F1 ATP synthase subunit delta [Gammaproteobacteria bacterium]
MQQNTTQARPYATAVFELAQAESDLAAWSEMLRLLNLIVSDSQMQKLLNDPRLDSEFLADFVLDISAERLSEAGMNFVRVLADAGRLSLAPQIYQLFEQRRTESEGVVDVEVVSAYELEQHEQDKIAAVMAKRFGKKINISTRIDGSLIGGMVIRTGDSVIDASIRGKLRQLGSELAE